MSSRVTCFICVHADKSLKRPNGTSPAVQYLSLPGKPGASFVGSCCRKVTWPTARDVFASNLLVARSDLQAAFVQQQDGKLLAWVTSTQGESKAVAGAVVQIYLSTYDQVNGWLALALQVVFSMHFCLL